MFDLSEKRRHIKVKLATCIAFLLIFIALFSGCSTSENWVAETIRENYYRFDGDYSDFEDLSSLTIDEMVAKLDIYSAYYTASEYESVLADNAGSKSGIGVSYGYVEGDGIIIFSVVGNSPAFRAGLAAGDVITGAIYGGEQIVFGSQTDFSSFITARATDETFTLVASDGREFTLAREEYTASYASMYTNDRAYFIGYDKSGKGKMESTGNGVSVLPDGAAYIYLSQFYGNAADEIASLISVFNDQKCTSLILDLRDDGGGYVDLMARIAGRFTSSLDDGQEKIAMVAKYKNGRKEITDCYSYETNLVPAGTDVYVMANDSTASASEALIGVLISYDILKYENIFLSKYSDRDAKTYGKGIMQSSFTNFITRETLKLTVAGIYWANGVTIHNRGLTAADGCSVAAASDEIVNVGYDDELLAVTDKILADRQARSEG